jgi:hypothetical protein
MKQLVKLLTIFAMVTGFMVMESQVSTAWAARILVDDFEGDEVTNKLGNRANVFIKAPSKAMVSMKEMDVQGSPSTVLMVRFDKRQVGGPYDSGGWCGYYTLLKSPGALVAPTEDNPNPDPLGDQYLDVEGNNAITFWVKGETGQENFVLGVSDRHWDRIGDSVKSEEIGRRRLFRLMSSSWITRNWLQFRLCLKEIYSLRPAKRVPFTSTTSASSN